MKKIIAVIFSISILTACHNSGKQETAKENTGNKQIISPAAKPAGDPAIAPAQENNVVLPKKVTTGIPTFSDPEVQQFAKDYKAFVLTYKDIKNNPEKVKVFKTQMIEWSKKANAVAAKLTANPTEAQQWADWVTSIAREIKMLPRTKQP